MAVAVDEQAQHHPRRILLVSGPTLVEAEPLGGKPIHRIDQEVHDVVLAHPNRADPAEGASGVSRSRFLSRVAIAPLR